MVHKHILPSTSLRNKSRSSSGIILERRCNLLLGLIIPREPMDPRLDEDKTEFGVLVLPIDFEVLADGNRLFDEVPEVLRDGWAKSYPQTKGMWKFGVREGGKKKGKKKKAVR